ncbi:GMC oxidoreductase [Streptomyces sp. NPDC059247]|uniref:GMC oxidoreductase n=1 Tax=Streptomyces sp. NPDC059247 TaxID=3346790 RepID=UPI0036CF6C3D
MSPAGPHGPRAEAAGPVYDVVVVGGGFAGTLMAHRLGAAGRRVLVLEAGARAGDAERGHREAVDTFLAATVKVPGSPYVPHPAAPWPEVTDLGPGGDGHLVQRGPLPYSSTYVRVNGGTGNVWTGLTPRMHPEDFRTDLFGYGRAWPLGYADLEPYYRAAEREIGVAADVTEQRAHVGLPFPDDYVFPAHALPPSHLDTVVAGRLDGRSVPHPATGEPVPLRVVGTPHGRDGVPNPAYGESTPEVRSTEADLRPPDLEVRSSAPDLRAPASDVRPPGPDGHASGPGVPAPAPGGPASAPDLRPPGPDGHASGPDARPPAHDVRAPAPDLRPPGPDGHTSGPPAPRPGGRLPGSAGGAPGSGGRRCEGHASCIPVCPSRAKYTPLRTQARWAPSVTLVDRAVASRVLVDGAGRATGVEYLAYGAGRAPGAATRHRVRADVVVLAAHAVENARLLLLSGLANRSDQVGRNLMDHPVLLTWGLLPDQVGPYRGPGSTSGLEGFRFGPARARHAPFRVEIGNWGWTWATGGTEADVAALVGGGGPDGRRLFGPALRTALRDRVGRQFALQFEIEQEADPANRVTLDPERRDALGLPRPVVSYDLSEHVREGFAVARTVSDRLFALLGAEDHSDHDPDPGRPGTFTHRGRTYAFRGAGHAGGTHIMGDDPATSVVDHWQRCWDHPGLYAVGCGSMPSLATSNPTLTMAALALRSAERVESDLTARDRRAAVGRDARPADPSGAAS